MVKEHKPTCFDCKLAIITGGYPDTRYEPGMPDMVEECNAIDENGKLEELKESVEYNENKLPELCGQFQPKMIEKCGNCNKEINSPEWSWKLWATTMWNHIPVCSKQCKQEVEDEDELEEMRAEGYSVGTIHGGKLNNDN